MDHILAKTKGSRKKNIFKLLSNQTLFDNINLNKNSLVEYNPDHNLDEDSWFKVNSFSKQPFCIDLIKDEFDSKDYANLSKDDFPKIAFLCSVQDTNYYFQKITPSLFLRRKTLTFGDIAIIENNNARLVINTLPDAIYFKAADTLIFKSLATISSIFQGIDELYKEATKEEVKQFLKEPFIFLSSTYNSKNVSKPNRKRIALAMATLGLLPEQDKADMLTYIGTYCGQQLKFNNDNGQFTISNDNELKLLIYGIEQRFYTTQIGQEKRLANSIQSLA